MQKANCRGHPRELFILPKGHSAHAGKAICRTCPVREPCLEYAIRTKSVGIWGGQVLDFKSDTSLDIQELYPVIEITDFKSQRIPSNYKVPAILGSRLAANFKRFPAILGTRNLTIQKDKQ